MTPRDVEDALALLRGPLAGRVIVFGSFGLLLHGARDPVSVPDLDVLCDPLEAPALGRALLAHGFDVWSWQDRLGADDVTAERLRGRIYLRARRDRLQVDLTYEGVDIAVWRADAVTIDGTAVGSVGRIEELRRHKR